MEFKTHIHAEEGKQEITITREFDLPLELLFKAYEEAELFEQWMGTKVIKLENKKHGSYQFETTAPGGFVLKMHGTIHEFIPNEKITRSFEMENTPMGVQLEFLEFTKINDGKSKLSMHSIFKSVDQRDQLLKMPFKQGVNMAHDRIQEILSKK